MLSPRESTYVLYELEVHSTSRVIVAREEMSGNWLMAKGTSFPMDIPYGFTRRDRWHWTRYSKRPAFTYAIGRVQGIRLWRFYLSCLTRKAREISLAPTGRWIDVSHRSHNEDAAVSSLGKLEIVVVQLYYTKTVRTRLAVLLGSRR